MTVARRRNGACGEIDDDTIELYAMGRLKASSAITHLNMCNGCKERVAEHRSWIEILKRGLQEYQSSAKARGDTGSASSPNDT